MKEKMEVRGNTQFASREDGMLVIGSRVCIPDVGELGRKIINEAHTDPYAIHPGSTKTYKDLKPFYWWPTMKTDVAEYMARCLMCQ